MQFKVPQNVQREDTIIGPVTLKQMMILGVGGGITYALYVSLAKTYFMEIWLPPVAITGGITLAFAFLKIHSLPFHKFLMNFIEYHVLPKKRTWTQNSGVPFMPPLEEESKNKKETPEKTDEKSQKSLEELTQIVDSHGATDKKNTTENTADEQEYPEDIKARKKEGLKQIINQNYK